MLSQSHSWFIRLMEVSGSEAFRLGWEQALMDPLARLISGPEEYDALNHVKGKNYDLDYYTAKENLTVSFTEELEDEAENRGSESHASKSERPEVVAKDQTDAKLKGVTSSGASGLEGCLEIPTSSGGFDDTLTITFGTPMLRSLEVRTLDFLEKDRTPQSLPPKEPELDTSCAASQGQPSEQS